VRAKKAGLSALFGRHSNSISRKYTRGYFFILASAFLVFIFSFINSQIVTYRYQREMDDLLAINRIYADVGKVHSMSPPFSIETVSNMKSEIDNTRQTIGQIFDSLNESYTREVLDLCCMVETYLDQTEEMADYIVYHIGSDNTDLFEVLNHPDFIALWQESESIKNYIEYSFRDIYAVKLLQTEQVHTSLSTFRLTMNSIQVLIVLVALGSCLLFYQRVVNGISKSVAQLTQFTKDINKNPEIQRRISIQTGDEIELFSVAFNEMLDQIQCQIAALEEDSQIKEKLSAVEMENLRVVSALQGSELKFLQSRINPHFLFNTLNMIVQTAKLEGADDTARLLETTAELLRYSLSKLSTPVSMADELENINNYLLIQQNRFGDRLSFLIETEAQCLSQQIPCMILQPLVENAITHGLGPKVDGGRVHLRIFRKDHQYCFEIEDDGVGIPSEKLEQIKSMCFGEKTDSSSIGIKNVYQRLMIFYQHDVIFKISSCCGKTLIHVELPWLL